MACSDTFDSRRSNVRSPFPSMDPGETGERSLQERPASATMVKAKNRDKPLRVFMGNTSLLTACQKVTNKTYRFVSQWMEKVQ